MISIKRPRICIQSRGLGFHRQGFAKLSKRRAGEPWKPACREPWPRGWSAGKVDRVYVGVDGVKVRSVTDAEKQKRCRQHELRRHQRERAGIGNTKPRTSRNG